MGKGRNCLLGAAQLGKSLGWGCPPVVFAIGPTEAATGGLSRSIEI
ncbi:MAG: hypothetical protein VKK80_03395 [Prochlorothrix sp.]|nr:hypothetical protein [Prochlorothrix sp.]